MAVVLPKPTNVYNTPAPCNDPLLKLPELIVTSPPSSSDVVSVAGASFILKGVAANFCQLFSNSSFAVPFVGELAYRLIRQNFWWFHLHCNKTLLRHFQFLYIILGFLGSYVKDFDLCFLQGFHVCKFYNYAFLSIGIVFYWLQIFR